jgi:hypothetical protein
MYAAVADYHLSLHYSTFGTACILALGPREMLKAVGEKHDTETEVNDLDDLPDGWIRDDEPAFCVRCVGPRCMRCWHGASSPAAQRVRQMATYTRHYLECVTPSRTTMCERAEARSLGSRGGGHSRMPTQSPIDPALRLRRGQEDLTSAQEVEAKRFAQERIRAQLSTESADEVEAERFLRQAYAAAGLPPPAHTHWVDGPLQLVEALALRIVTAGVTASAVESAPERVRERIGASVTESLWERIGAHALVNVEGNVLNVSSG